MLPHNHAGYFVGKSDEGRCFHSGPRQHTSKEPKQNQPQPEQDQGYPKNRPDYRHREYNPTAKQDQAQYDGEKNPHQTKQERNQSPNDAKGQQ